MQLIDKESALSLLKKEIEIQKEEMGNDYFAAVLQLHCEKISSLPVYGEWISVKERLPDEDVYVLASM